MIQKASCWMLDLGCSELQEPLCIVQLGRYGDLIQLFPAFKLLGEQTGLKPIVMVSSEFANVFEAVSYVLPWTVPLRWWQDSAKAKKAAGQRFRHVIVPQYWNDLSERHEQKKVEGKLYFRAHGQRWVVEGESADYGTAMWNRLGFTRAQMISTPLVLDRRNPERETQLVTRFVRPDQPMILYNLKGFCSPFPWVPEVLEALRPYRAKVNLVDLGPVRAERIFDLLGLYDKAIGLITSDTATAHLAPASPVPTIWLTVDSTGTSVPKGNVALHVKYSEIPKRLPEIIQTVRGWIGI